MKKELTKESVRSGLDLLLKDCNVSMDADQSEHFVDRVFAFVTKHDWAKYDHFYKTCMYIVTHYTEFRTMNVAVFNTAFAKVNYPKE